MSDNPSVLQLPSGATVDLSNWTYGAFRSACIVDPYAAPVHQWDLFSYGRSQQIGDSGVMATMTHTNVPRNGDSGLPKDWEMLLYGWKATCSRALSEPILEFASQCAVRFEYNNKIYGQTMLAELLLGTAKMSGPTGTRNLPVHMRENLMFSMRVFPDPKALDTLTDYMRSEAPSKVDEATIAELAQVTRLAPENLAVELRRIQRKLQPVKPLIIWGVLEGYILSTVF